MFNNNIGVGRGRKDVGHEESTLLRISGNSFFFPGSGFIPFLGLLLDSFLLVTAAGSTGCLDGLIGVTGT